MAQLKRPKHKTQQLTALQFLLYSTAVASALFNVRLCKELIVSRALAAEAHGNAVAYRNTLEGLVTTLHGKVHSAFICKLRPEAELTYEASLITKISYDTALLHR